MNTIELTDISLAAPCGIYCGTCSHYLAREKSRLAEKKLKHGCKGCRVQNKNCSWVKKNCTLLRKNQVAFCYECSDYPCEKLEKLHLRHIANDHLNLFENLDRIKNIGAQLWLLEQQEHWKCPVCGGSFCVMDQSCYDCGYKKGKITK